jgi:hypothetical protein
MATTNVKKKSGSNIGLIGASIVGLATAAYFFFGPKGKKNQKDAKAWTLKMKAEVIGELEKAKVMSEPVYHKIIDTVAAKYRKELKASPKEVQSLVNDLKDHWKIIGRSVETLKPVVKKEIKKVVKKGEPMMAAKTVKPKVKSKAKTN